MIHQPEIWALIKTYLPRRTWIHLHKIYDLVKKHADLGNDDFYPQSPTSNLPKWKRNVRNVLQYRKNPKRAEILWNKEDESYYLP
jgi:hypothetical protein